MTGAAPRDRERLHREIAQRPAVFDAEGVVWAREQRRRSGIQRRKLLLPVCGVGQAGTVARGRGKRIQRLGGLLNQRNISGFRAEGQIPAADAVQQRDRAARKAFGGAERRRERQLEHKVRAAPNRRFCAGVLVEHGEVAALYEISAHHADDDGVTAETFTRAADMKHMAAVKRIVFRDNAADRRKRIHQITSMRASARHSIEIAPQFPKNREHVSRFFDPERENSFRMGTIFRPCPAKSGHLFAVKRVLQRARSAKRSCTFDRNRVK